MADDVKVRTLPLSPLPSDEAFVPGGMALPEPDLAHINPADLAFADNAIKIAQWRSTAQQFATDWGCAVLLHYYALPGFERTNATMCAAYIPADEGKAQLPAPPA